MENKSRERMNLSAIKKVDPYANEIVDSSSHVAFYTFNPGQSEWEKTDIEGAFFIYNRSGQPFYSIFINNRLNTTTFVEPITSQFELQLQPPFLLYRNERSRIRGYWFYNSEECKRIGDLVGRLIQKANCKFNSFDIESSSLNQSDINIFNLLAKARQKLKFQTNTTETSNETSCNVLEFFARTAEVPGLKQLTNTVSVEQVEKEQRFSNPIEKCPQLMLREFEETQLPKNTGLITTVIEDVCVNDIKSKVKNEAHQSDEAKIEKLNSTLLLPSMLDKSVHTEPLTRAQLVEAFKYLIQNDDDFINRIYEAYLQTTKSNLNDN